MREICTCRMLDHRSFFICTHCLGVMTLVVQSYNSRELYSMSSTKFKASIDFLTTLASGGAPFLSLPGGKACMWAEVAERQFSFMVDQHTSEIYCRMRTFVCVCGYTHSISCICLLVCPLSFTCQVEETHL